MAIIGKKKPAPIPLVSDILAVFNETITQLQKVDDAQAQELDKIEAHQQALDERRAVATMEQQLARSAATRIKDLVSGPYLGIPEETL